MSPGGTIPDEIFIHDPDSAKDAHKSHHHIIFIPGNPGLIAYYVPFLHLLHSHFVRASLGASGPTAHVSIFARSLAGFELRPRPESQPSSDALLDLEAQIAHTEAALLAHLTHLPTLPSGCTRKLTLVSHSVGAFITLELLRRRRLASLFAIELAGAVLLFPTVVDIALSPHGRKLGLLLNLPDALAAAVGTALAFASRALTAALPSSWLVALVVHVLGMTEDAAAVTAAFLGSARGVAQALYMGRDEMRQITADQWDEGIWAATAAGCVRSESTFPSATQAETNAAMPPKLFFLFGMEDYWVAERTRDDLIANRARRTGDDPAQAKPRMEIDESGVPHGFCIRHNVPIAKKVATYIEDIIAAYEEK